MQHGQTDLQQATARQGNAKHIVQGKLAQPGMTSFTLHSNVPTQTLPELMCALRDSHQTGRDPLLSVPHALLILM